MYTVFDESLKYQCISITAVILYRFELAQQQPNITNVSIKYCLFKHPNCQTRQNKREKAGLLTSCSPIGCRMDSLRAHGRSVASCLALAPPPVGVCLEAHF